MKLAMSLRERTQECPEPPRVPALRLHHVVPIGCDSAVDLSAAGHGRMNKPVTLALGSPAHRQPSPEQTQCPQ